ncbi:MAG: ferrous iron transport protein A [Clostridia bacterium]|nr:ferrous iron transport protein A [Clostridia bacterium]
MKKLISMDKIKPNEKATVRRIETCGSIRRRLMDIGLAENSQIECVGRSPMGDPSAYLICGAVVAIRKSDCSKIYVEV